MPGLFTDLGLVVAELPNALVHGTGHGPAKTGEHCPGGLFDVALGGLGLEVQPGVAGADLAQHGLVGEVAGLQQGEGRQSRKDGRGQRDPAEQGGVAALPGFLVGELLAHLLDRLKGALLKLLDLWAEFFGHASNRRCRYFHSACRRRESCGIHALAFALPMKAVMTSWSPPG